MKTELSFEKEETKKLLSKLDFEFFLKQNIRKENYNEKDVETIYSSYRETNAEIKIKARGNKTQSNYYAEGQVRKMFTGGFLPAMFELDESRGHRLLDFKSVGENWAYFKHWQTFQKRKVTKEKIWDIIFKIGSVSAILLSIQKIIEMLFPINKS